MFPCMGSATIGFGAMAPQILEKINEYLKFTIFNNFDALPPPPQFKPVVDPMSHASIHYKRNSM